MKEDNKTLKLKDIFLKHMRPHYNYKNMMIIYSFDNDKITKFSHLYLHHKRCNESLYTIIDIEKAIYSIYVVGKEIDYERFEIYMQGIFVLVEDGIDFVRKLNLVKDIVENPVRYGIVI